jgi:hypothetical protein
MPNIIADLRDDLISAFKLNPNQSPEDLADIAIEEIRRWCVKEPTNDNEA